MSVPTALVASVPASGQVRQAMTGGAITAAIKTAWAADPALSAGKIEIRTQGGVVRK